jgi:glutathione synthase/RimK-type ligase-like ATP-grasp enzyme
MSFLLAEFPNHDLNAFDLISMPKEVFVSSKELPLVDYMVTLYPRNENSNTFPFVYGLFESKNVAFGNNQEVILNIANKLFSESLPLNSFEQLTLNMTFKKSIKTKPTLSGRK